MLGHGSHPGDIGRHQGSHRKSLPSRCKGRDANDTNSAASTQAQNSPSEMETYQHTRPPPPKQTPTYPCSHSSTFLWAKKPDTKESIQSLTHCRTSLHRIHGLSLNTATNRVFTASQQWNLIYRGKPGHWGVLSKTKDVESRSNGDAQITQTLF